MTVLQAVKDTTRVPEYRPKIPEDCLDQVKTLMQVSTLKTGPDKTYWTLISHVLSVGVLAKQ